MDSSCFLFTHYICTLFNKILSIKQNMKYSILCCIGILGLTACTPTTPSHVQVPEIRVITPETSGHDFRRNYTFISNPFRVTELSFRVGGPIRTFSIQNGQFFRKGELIRGSTATTVPLTLECTGALMNPAASPIF